VVNAEAAATRAADLLEAGEFGAAALAFEESAEAHRAAGDAVNESHGRRFAATMWRLAGTPRAGVESAERAIELAAPASPPRVSALTELGESALAAGDTARAVGAYKQALEEGAPAGMPVAVQAALLRRQAVALQHDGRHDEAVEALRRAQELYRDAGDQQEALAAQVEEATLLQGTGDLEAAARVAAAARTAAEAASDRRALANLDLLAAGRAVDEERAEDALAATRAARDHALAAVDPVLYTGAAIAESELAEAAEDRVGAYRSLAAGWASVSELIGSEPARMAFEPRLAALRERWGADAFAEVRAAYEEGRRAERAGGAGAAAAE
jgi:tetratricopeptide (TPR) repeat protein